MIVIDDLDLHVVGIARDLRHTAHHLDDDFADGLTAADDVLSSHALGGFVWGSLFFSEVIVHIAASGFQLARHRANVEPVAPLSSGPGALGEFETQRFIITPFLVLMPLSHA